MFDPKTDRFPYPEYTAEYPYVDQSKPFERRRRWFRMF